MEGRRLTPLDGQGEAVAVAVAVAEDEDVVCRGVCSGVRTVFSTVFSTVTVRAGEAGGVAPSLAPPPMRPRKNPNSSPSRSPTASVSTNALAGPGLLLLAVRISLLLPMVIFSHRLGVSTLGCPFEATESRLVTRVATRRASRTPHAPASYENDAIAPSQLRTSENTPSTHSAE